MKLLLFSDLHNDTGAAQHIVSLSGRADVLIGAGDFCNARHGLERCLDLFRPVGKPLVLVAGNNESTDELADVCRDWPNAHVLHGSSAVIGGVTFFGLGGGIPVTPFGPWSYDFSEDQAEKLLAPCPPGCVLVSHSPPKGAVDVSSSGRSLGSIAVREAIERTKPLLVVCGHIHASAVQQAVVGSSPVVNAGPAGIEWELRERPTAGLRGR